VKVDSLRILCSELHYIILYSAVGTLHTRGIIHQSITLKHYYIIELARSERVFHISRVVVVVLYIDGVHTSRF
jgi:hypothetical protein